MKKLLSIILFLLPTLAMAIDKPIPCTGNSCKLLFETTGSGGAKVSAGNVDGLGKWTIGPAASTESHIINGKIQFQETNDTYEAILRAGTTSSIASGATYDIATVSEFHGFVDVQCNNSGNGNITSARLYRVVSLGASGWVAQEVGSQINGSSACNFTVTIPADSIIRLTNSGTCTGASSMTCHWIATYQQAD